MEEVLVDCSGPEEEERREETAFVRKRDMMVQNLLKRPVDRTLVFCNSIPSCRRVRGLFLSPQLPCPRRHLLYVQFIASPTVL